MAPKNIDKITAKKLKAMDLLSEVGRDEEREKQAILRAMANTLPAWLNMITARPDLLRDVFITMEAAAKTSDAKKIANHDLRPTGIDNAVTDVRTDLKGRKT
ncbi:hypothetical protein KUW09_12975 [Mameliella alba]|nr:hypothetical protein [Antarctobacter heliothermus]MBY6144964.1 hypothetical protein [Mameliella alba]MCA0955958.1 hypothetical protein [Mameliella alba]